MAKSPQSRAHKQAYNTPMVVSFIVCDYAANRIYGQGNYQGLKGMIKNYHTFWANSKQQLYFKNLIFIKNNIKKGKKKLIIEKKLKDPSSAPVPALA